MAVRRTKAEKEDPKWVWEFDEYDSLDAVEEAVADAISDLVLDNGDTQVTGPDGKEYDIEVTVKVVSR